MTAPCGAPTMARSNFHGLGFTLFLAALTALPPLSIDMALPSLALIQADLHAPQTKAAAAIAIFIAGFSTAPIVVGPLTDRFGRNCIRFRFDSREKGFCKRLSGKDFQRFVS